MATALLLSMALHMGALGWLPIRPRPSPGDVGPHSITVHLVAGVALTPRSSKPSAGDASSRPVHPAVSPAAPALQGSPLERSADAARRPGPLQPKRHRARPGRLAKPTPVSRAAPGTEPPPAAVHALPGSPAGANRHTDRSAASEQPAATLPRYAADYLRNPPPVYPPLARRRRLQGTVLVRVHVGVQGAVLDLQVERSSGHEILDRAALGAVRAWRFLPARRGATPVEAWVRVPLDFRLVE
jgi:protein TonB